MPATCAIRLSAALACVCLLSAQPAGADQTLAAGATELRLTEGLAITGVSNWGRRTIYPDAVAEALARGTLGSPRDGDTLKSCWSFAPTCGTTAARASSAPAS